MIVTANNSTSAVENIRTVIQTGPYGWGPAPLVSPSRPAPRRPLVSHLLERLLQTSPILFACCDLHHTIQSWANRICRDSSEPPAPALSGAPRENVVCDEIYRTGGLPTARGLSRAGFSPRRSRTSATSFPKPYPPASRNESSADQRSARSGSEPAHSALTKNRHRAAAQYRCVS